MALTHVSSSQAQLESAQAQAGVQAAGNVCRFPPFNPPPSPAGMLTSLCPQ